MTNRIATELFHECDENEEHFRFTGTFVLCIFTQVNIHCILKCHSDSSHCVIVKVVIIYTINVTAMITTMLCCHDIISILPAEQKGNRISGHGNKNNNRV